METSSGCSATTEQPPPTITLRGAAPRRHGLGGAPPRRALRREYGLDASFEALVAEIAANF